MRIDHLSTDNARTQGSARRAWYARHNPEHLRGVAVVVERALAASAVARRAEELAPSGAIVLGAGACTEIPLERMVRACGRVVLADLDLAGMERARLALPSPLRAQVEILDMDLSGGASAALADPLQAQPWGDLARLGVRSVVDAAATCLESCVLADPSDAPAFVGRRFRLVLSSLVMTQLFSLPLLDVLDTIGRVHPEAIAIAAEQPRYLDAADAFRGRVARAHLDLLAALVAPGGAVALISDVTGYLTPATSAAVVGASREQLQLFPREALDLPAEVRARFVVAGAPQQWEWVVSPPSATLPGRSYAVEGFVLRRSA